jgi:TrmH family RNA methyltransferase
MTLSKAEIKVIQSLKTSHGRKKHQSFIVEGPKLLEELLNTNFKVKYFLATKEWASSNESIENTIVFKPDELNKFSLFSKANQVIAIVDYPNKTQKSINTNHYVLALDTIQDPGNLGTILRTADWFGIRQIICSPETADIFNPKVIQASMGSIFRVNVIYTNLKETISSYPELPVYGTLLSGDPIQSISFKENGFIIIGNESKGISEELKKLIKQAVYIPKANTSKTESLNAAVACGILLSNLSKV